MIAEKWTYRAEEINAKHLALVGNKAVRLGMLYQFGLPVPPFFTVTTEACSIYMKEGGLNQTLSIQIAQQLKYLENVSGKVFGSNMSPPLLLSIRSGAAVSMPGMMDTLLNVGINDASVQSLADEFNSLPLAWNTYNRLVRRFGEIVYQVPSHLFDDAFEENDLGNLEHEFFLQNIQSLKNLNCIYQNVIHKYCGEIFPQNCWNQLELAIKAVFLSWKSKRSRKYRQKVKISDQLGTAVTVMTMVLGHINQDSGTGIVFSRNPITGIAQPYGEFIANAQGEDIVSGVRTPNHIDVVAKMFPEIWNQLQSFIKRIEAIYKRPQEIEFTIQDKSIWILQTRDAQLTDEANLVACVEMAQESIISKEIAIERTVSCHLTHLSQKVLFRNDFIQSNKILAKGIPASSGIAVGKVCFDPEIVEQLGKQEDLILVRKNTSPDDLQGMLLAKGILTINGGATSHAAVVARQFGKPCIVGCGDFYINVDDCFLQIGHVRVDEGDYISIDGSKGDIYLGCLPIEVKRTHLSKYEEIIFNWQSELSDNIVNLSD